MGYNFYILLALWLDGVSKGMSKVLRKEVIKPNVFRGSSIFVLNSRGILLFPTQHKSLLRRYWEGFSLVAENSRGVPVKLHNLPHRLQGFHRKGSRKDLLAWGTFLEVFWTLSRPAGSVSWGTSLCAPSFPKSFNYTWCLTTPSVNHIFYLTILDIRPSLGKTFNHFRAPSSDRIAY